MGRLTRYAATVVSDRMRVLVVFVLVVAVSAWGLWRTGEAIDVARETIRTNRVLLRTADAQAERLADRITMLLAQADALRSHIAVLDQQVRDLGGEPPPRPLP